MLLSLYTISYALLALCTISNAATLQINIIDDSLPEPELISAEVSKSKLPPCSNTDRPCSCPKPATLHNISTFAVLGANAWAVRGVMGSFFDTAWAGAAPDSVTGKNNVVGATRWNWYKGPNGGDDGFELGENLTQYKAFDDGSFILSFAMIGNPPNVTKPDSMGGGIFRGFWGTINAFQTVVANETAIKFNQYRCDVGSPYNTGSTNEWGLRNASWVLFNLGELTGIDIPPYSINYE